MVDAAEIKVNIIHVILCMMGDIRAVEIITWLNMDRRCLDRDVLNCEANKLNESEVGIATCYFFQKFYFVSIYVNVNVKSDTCRKCMRSNNHVM